MRAWAALPGTTGGAGTSGIGRPRGVLKHSRPSASRTTVSPSSWTAR